MRSNLTLCEEGGVEIFGDALIFWIFFSFLVLARKILDERLLFFLLMHLDFSFKQNMVDRPITAPTLVAFGISNSELRFIFNCSMIFLTSW